MTDLFENIITRAVADRAERLESLDSDALARVDAASRLDMGDWLELGDKASRALAHGLIDADSAQTLYRIHSSFHGGASLAERVVYLQAMGEICSALIAGRA